METELTVLGIFVGAFITLFIQKYERLDKFRLVAIEKRLHAHQEAFSLWYKMIWIIHKEGNEKTEVLTTARDFWVNNCIYLEKKTRQEFDTVISLVDFYSIKLHVAREATDTSERKRLKKEYLDDWDQIHRLAALIQEEVKLEPIVPKLKITAEGN